MERTQNMARASNGSAIYGCVQSAVFWYVTSTELATGLSTPYQVMASLVARVTLTLSFTSPLACFLLEVEKFSRFKALPSSERGYTL